jgi:hypothetical protein
LGQAIPAVMPCTAARPAGATEPGTADQVQTDLGLLAVAAQTAAALPLLASVLALLTRETGLALLAFQATRCNQRR